MQVELQQLGELLVPEIELVEQVCLQLEKDLALKESLPRPASLFLLYDALFPHLVSILDKPINHSSYSVSQMLYAVDVSEKRSQGTEEELAEQILLRIFQKIFLRNRFSS